MADAPVIASCAPHRRALLPRAPPTVRAAPVGSSGSAHDRARSDRGALHPYPSVDVRELRGGGHDELPSTVPSRTIARNTFRPPQEQYRPQLPLETLSARRSAIDSCSTDFVFGNAIAAGIPAGSDWSGPARNRLCVDNEGDAMRARRGQFQRAPSTRQAADQVRTIAPRSRSGARRQLWP